jgi:HlyD family secretion protein
MRRALCVSLLLAAAAGAGCRRGPADGAIVAAGHVEATEVRLSAKVGGRLASLAVREGDAVAAGQEVARIDTTDLELALAQARAERDQAGAELRLRRAGARAEDIAELAAQVTALRAEAEGAERDLQRMQGLLDKGSGTAKARDDARTRRDALAARAAALEQALLRARAGFRAEEIEAARARHAGIQARLAQIEQQVRDATVTSPRPGTVTEKVAEAGELVAPGTVLVVVTDLADAWLTAYVAEPDLGRLRLGQQAEVRTDGGERRTGTLAYLAPRAEFTPRNVQTRDERVKLVYKIKVALPNGDGLFKPGMPAEASLPPAGS